MSDLINRQKAIEALGEAPKFKIGLLNKYAEGRNDQWFDDVAALVKLPSAQPEIIRCKDCRYTDEDGVCQSSKGLAIQDDDDFCSHAERRKRMSDLIDRMVAIDHWRTIIDATDGDSRYDMGFVDGLEFCISDLSTMPSTQPERKTGRWIPQDHNRRTGYVTTTVYYYPKCSECGYSGNYGMNFCPNCGADMEGDEE